MRNNIFYGWDKLYIIFGKSPMTFKNIRDTNREVGIQTMMEMGYIHKSDTHKEYTFTDKFIQEYSNFCS